MGRADRSAQEDKEAGFIETIKEKVEGFKTLVKTLDDLITVLNLSWYEHG